MAVSSTGISLSDRFARQLSSPPPPPEPSPMAMWSGQLVARAKVQRPPLVATHKRALAPAVRWTDKAFTSLGEASVADRAWCEALVDRILSAPDHHIEAAPYPAAAVALSVGEALRLDEVWPSLRKPPARGTPPTLTFQRRPCAGRRSSAPSWPCGCCQQCQPAWDALVCGSFATQGAWPLPARSSSFRQRASRAENTNHSKNRPRRTKSRRVIFALRVPN